MDAEIQKAVEAGRLTEAAGRALARLQPGTLCLHRSWGIGRVSAINFLLNQVLVDFQSRKAHPMQLQYAADTLQPLADDHVLARKTLDPAGLRARATNEPLGLLRELLRDLGGKATPDQMAQVLVPEVFSAEEFRKWWASVKKAAIADGHFAVPAKKNEPVTLRAAPVARGDELIAAFRNARQLKAQLVALEAIHQQLEALAGKAEQVRDVIDAATEVARKNQRLHPREALEILLARDALAQVTQTPVAGLSLPQLLREETAAVGRVLEALPAGKIRRVLAAFPEAFGGQWVARALGLFAKAGAKAVPEIARLLKEQGQQEALRRELERTIRDHAITPEALIWLCKERGSEFDSLRGSSLLGAILNALEHSQIAGGKRGAKLHDLLLHDKALLPDLLAGADPETVRNFFRRILHAPVFNDVDKRSLLGRIIRAHPEMEALLPGRDQPQNEALIVSWESLEKRKAEYEELVNRKIPANSQEIAIARSYGDLRENFEFKAAKEMQRVLMRRKAELEHDLARARGTDFSNADTSRVSIGTVVELREVAGGKIDRYAILGAWDSDPARGIISYPTAIAQALIGRTVGEQVTVPGEDGTRVAEIVSITAWKQPAP